MNNGNGNGNVSGRPAMATRVLPPLSPSRSITSNMKKTRFAPNEIEFKFNDDHTVQSAATNQPSITPQSIWC
jgi:hypothetical protein